MSSKLDRIELEKQTFTVARDPRTNSIRSVNTIHDLKVGVVQKKASILASGDLKVFGSSYFTDGVEGALTLPSGLPTVRAGSNVAINNNTDGSIVISAAADVSSLYADFAAVPGLVSSLSTQVSNLASTVSSFASSLGTVTSDITDLQTVVDSVQLTTNILSNNATSLSSFVNSTSSSLDTRITQVSSSLESTVSFVSSSLAARITSASGSISALSGSFTSLSGSVSAIEAQITGLRGGLGVGLSMNELVVGDRDGMNKTFTLSHAPSPASSLMIFLNGQLLAGGAGSDFLVLGDEVTLSPFVPAPEHDDVLLAMYSYAVSVKSYSINEPAIVTSSSPGVYEIELANTPSPPESLMLFMNGQLLTAGETNDYNSSGKTISLESSLADIGDSRFFATYSY